MNDYYARNSANTCSMAIRWLGQSPRNLGRRLAGPSLLTISYGDPVEGRLASRCGAHGARPSHRRACVQRLPGTPEWLRAQGYSINDDSVQRYGVRLRQQLDAIKLSSHQARALAAAGKSARDTADDLVAINA